MDDGEAIQKLGPANGDLNVAPELGTATPFPPPQQNMPTGWVNIPQRNYDHPQINSFPQWEKITFSVNNSPGFKLQDALFHVYKGLNGRDDSVLQGAKGPVSCRLLVRRRINIFHKKVSNSSSFTSASSPGILWTPQRIKCDSVLIPHLSTYLRASRSLCKTGKRSGSLS